jgi:hypothetical protein
MSKPAGKPAYDLIADESPDIVEDMKKIFDDPEPWLDRPIEWLWGRKPREMIGTEDEIHLRNWLRMLKYGIPT